MRTEDKNFLIAAILIIFIPVVAVLGLFVAGFFNQILLIPVPIAIYVIAIFLFCKNRANQQKLMGADY